MKVLFIGGTGIISTAVSDLAVRKGIDLYLLNRGNKPELVPEGAKVIKGNVRDPESAARVLQGMEFDAVVDWIAFLPEHVRNDVELFQGRTGQYIFISSASAYQKPPTHYLVTESTPLCNPYWQYSRDKIACEELLLGEYRRRGFPTTIVRPSYTYGPTAIPAALNSWEHSWSIVDRMLKGKKIIVPGDGTSLWVMTHNTDFAKGFLGLLCNRLAVGHAFHITSDEVLTWDQIHEAIGGAACVKPDIIHISSDFLSAAAPDLEGGLLGDKTHSIVFDNAKLKRFVPEYAATVRFADGIKRTVDWFMSRPERRTVDAAWNGEMDRIVGLYEAALTQCARPV